MSTQLGTPVSSPFDAVNTSVAAAPNFIVQSSPLVVGGQQMGGGFQFAVNFNPNMPGVMLNEAAGLTANSFASNNSFLQQTMDTAYANQASVNSTATGAINQILAIAQTTAQADASSSATMASNAGGSGSYITTAVCLATGEGIDGPTLSDMRAWRDRWFFRVDGAESLFRKYARYAPALIKRIDKRADARRVYMKMYRHFIGPAVEMMRERGVDAAGRDVYDLYLSLIRYAREKARG